jgi:asparagine synthase (glutamine-hydrolysing)
MCGIFGIVTRLSEQDVSGAVARATAALEHRGPDDTGIEFVSRGEVTAALAHTRLAIIDLSAAGHQPMRDEVTGSWITFNGEVFNFRDLQSDLAEQGVQFRSNSDTEVLLKGYRLRGRKAIDGWRGMFALGIWEQAPRRLTLVRDRLGIKPLYYYFDGQNFIFASEVRAILQTGLVPRKLCAAAVDSYLSYGSVQQPLTIVEGIHQLLPGHTLTLEEWQVTTEPYWELHADAADGVENGADASGEMRQLLEEAVRLRLVSDVPVGVFLSGGIDSSAVVALLRRASVDRIKSFSVCFQEEEFSERIYAEQVARHFETEHTSVVVTADEVLGKLPAALAAMDQPSIDGVNTYIVSEAVASAGLKVAISGLGGDEVFAGYSFFRNIARDERRRAQASRVPAGVRRAVGAAIGAVASSNRVTKISGLLSESEFDGHAVMSHRRLFSAGQRRRLLAVNGNAGIDQSAVRSWTMRQLANCEHADAINQASMLDLGGYLSNTLLRDTDTMSMAHSLEVRVPLIDHLVVERALRIPGDLKLRAGRPKWLLVEAAGDLPHEIVDRPKKGFELPFKHWLLGALSERVSDALASPAMEGLFKPGSARGLWEEFEAGRVSWARVWSLFVLDEWTRRNL